MVVVDRLTKLVRLLPAKKDDSAPQVADRFIKGWYSLGYGLPQSIVSDRDSKFSSKFWTAIGNSWVLIYISLLLVINKLMASQKMPSALISVQPKSLRQF